MSTGPISFPSGSHEISGARPAPPSKDHAQQEAQAAPQVASMSRDSIDTVQGQKSNLNLPNEDANRGAKSSSATFG